MCFFIEARPSVKTGQQPQTLSKANFDINRFIRKQLCAVFGASLINVVDNVLQMTGKLIEEAHYFWQDLDKVENEVGRMGNVLLARRLTDTKEFLDLSDQIFHQKSENGNPDMSS